MKRPLLWAAIAFACGIFASARMGGGWAGAVAPFVFAVILAAWRPRRAWRDAAALAALFFALGFMNHAARVAGSPGDALSRHSLAHPGAVYTLEGRVRSVPLFLPDTGYLRLIVDVDHAVCDGQSLAPRGGLTVPWTDPAFAVHAGERVRVEGRLTHALGPVNHGISGLEDYLRGRGVHSELRARGGELEIIDSPCWSPAYWASRIRAWEARAFARAVPPEVLPFVLAVWLGERGGIDTLARQDFIDSGTAHILAVSGVHCGIIYYSVIGLLRVLRQPRRRRALFTMAAVFAFALIAGARVSTLRAALMFALYLTADCFLRERDAPTALGIAALAFLAWNPLQLFDAGFLLSFGSVASLLIFAQPLAARLPQWLGPVRQPLAAALAVQLVPLPLALHFFHVLPWLAPLVNVAVVALLGAVLWLCLLRTACAVLLPPAAALFGNALLPVVKAIEFAARGAAALPWAHWNVTSPTPIAMVCYWAAVACLAMLFYKRLHARRWALGGAALILCSVLFWRPMHFPATVDWLDVGHGDAIFVRTPGNTTLLIDGGNRSEYTDMGVRVVLPFLYANGVSRLDYVISTHPDQDHLGGLLSVIERMPVGAVVLSAAAGGDPLEAAILARCAERGIPVRRLARGDSIPASGAKLAVLNPPRDGAAGLSDNDRSLALHLSWPGVSILFTGDIEAEAERAVAAEPCQAAILTAPHHGSATSSSALLLDAVRPRHAIISTSPVGARAPVGRGVIERYSQRGIQVWRTDVHGGMRLRMDSAIPSLYGARPARGYTLAFP